MGVGAKVKKSRPKTIEEKPLCVDGGWERRTKHRPQTALVVQFFNFVSHNNSHFGAALIEGVDELLRALGVPADEVRHSVLADGEVVPSSLMLATFWQRMKES